jgi:hypothetical protein
MPQYNFIDHKRKKFGEWTVIERAPNMGRTAWICKCSCGNSKVIPSVNLTRGKSTRCLKCASIKRSKHLMSKSTTYSIWVQMKERCYKTNHPSYMNYGSRGITVCDRWKESFSNFIEDMGEAEKGMSIERIDNNLGYFKENCKWENWKNQCRNKRISIRDGDIYNNWIVKSKIPNEKKYNIECINCKKTHVIWSCNVRTKKKCDCLSEETK